MDEPSPNDPPNYVPSWWERGRFRRGNHAFDRSPTRVLIFYVLMATVGIVILVEDISDPNRVNGAWAIRSLVGAVLLLPIVVIYAPRAWKARQAQRRDR
jgi:hypothetical protein